MAHVVQNDHLRESYLRGTLRLVLHNAHLRGDYLRGMLRLRREGGGGGGKEEEKKEQEGGRGESKGEEGNGGEGERTLFIQPPTSRSPAYAASTGIEDNDDTGDNGNNVDKNLNIEK